MNDDTRPQWLKDMQDRDTVVVRNVFFIVVLLVIIATVLWN